MVKLTLSHVSINYKLNILFIIIIIIIILFNDYHVVMTNLSHFYLGLVLLYGGPNLQEGFVSLGLKDSRLQATFFDGRQTHVVEGGFTRLEEWTEVEFKVGDDGGETRV